MFVCFKYDTWYVKLSLALPRLIWWHRWVCQLTQSARRSQGNISFTFAGLKGRDKDNLQSFSSGQLNSFTEQSMYFVQLNGLLEKCTSFDFVSNKRHGAYLQNDVFVESTGHMLYFKAWWDIDKNQYLCQIHILKRINYKSHINL